MKKITFIIFLIPIFLFGNFIGMNNGARSLGMGNAFVALSDGGSAIFYNPAGLARTKQINVTASLQDLYGISDLSSSMIALSFPTPIVRTGIAVQRINLLDVYSEQILYLSAASIIKPKNIPIRFGVSLKYESAKIEDYEDATSPFDFDFDFGVLIDLSDNLFFGYSIKHLLKPEFKFISSTDQLPIIQSTGICYNWRGAVNLLADYLWDENDSRWSVGSEIWFYDIFAARLGMFDEKLTVGFGLDTKKWSLDTAVLSHEQLGSTYRISLGINFGVEK